MLQSKRRTTAAAALMAWAGLCGAAEPSAGSDKLPFSITAPRLVDALLQFTEQSGLQLALPTESAAHLPAPRVVGQLTAKAALERLLQGSGLAYEFTNDRTVSITAAAPERSSEATAGKDTGGKSDAPVEQSGNPDTARLQERSSHESLEEIVVTAQKRAERLIDVPQSVTVLSSDTLAKLGATQFRDFATTVPGLTYMTTGAGNTQITLRGVTAGFDSSPTVGVYVDEVPYGASGAFGLGARLALDVGLFDVERIEVLRGPQGTLYGASTMGGLLKYVSKTPDLGGSSVDLRTGISDTRHGRLSYDVAGAVNAPLADTAALRVSSFLSRDGGYVDNLALGAEDVDRADLYGGRADLLLTPSEALTVRIGAFLQNISRDSEATADFTLAGESAGDGLVQSRQLAEPFEQRFRLVSGTATYGWDAVTLTSISSYQTMRAGMGIDRSRHFVPVLGGLGLAYSAVGTTSDVETSKFTQEMRLASNAGEPLEWVLGGFYTSEHTEGLDAFVLRDPAGQPAENFLLTGAIDTRLSEAAAFGNVTWRLTDEFDVSGGVRYARNRQKFEQAASGIAGVSTDAPRRSSESVLTYLANARYHFSDRATAYVRYATGYRPGGPNFVGADPDTGLPFAPETFESDRLKSYEIGFKAESDGGRFGIDLAGYYGDWSNMQVATTRAGFGVLINADGGATVRGLELSLRARPVDALTLTGAFAYQQAELSEPDADLGAAQDDERLPNVPRFTAAINADYRLSVGALEPTLGTTVRHVSERLASFSGNIFFPQYRLPDYTTVDLRAGFSIRAVDLQLYVRNVFDERGQLAAQTWRSPFDPLALVAISQPRTFGLSATTHF